MGESFDWCEYRITGNVRARRAKEQAEAMLSEFIDSKCDLYSSADFFYYADETGKTAEELVRLATFSGPIENAVEYAILNGDSDLVELLIPLLS